MSLRLLVANISKPWSNHGAIHFAFSCAHDLDGAWCTSTLHCLGLWVVKAHSVLLTALFTFFKNYFNHCLIRIPLKCKIFFKRDLAKTKVVTKCAVHHPEHIKHKKVWVYNILHNIILNIVKSINIQHTTSNLTKRPQKQSRHHDTSARPNLRCSTVPALDFT